MRLSRLRPALTGALAVLLLGGASVAALAEPIAVLVIDETETFTESIAVNTIVGLLKQRTDLFSVVDAVIVSVGSPFDLPFLQPPSGGPYDLVIVVPKGALSLGEIWLITHTYPQRRPDLMAAVDFLTELARDFGQRFSVALSLRDITRDLFVGILSGFFSRLGMLSA